MRHWPESLLTRVWLEVTVHSCSRLPQQLAGSSHSALAALFVQILHQLSAVRLPHSTPFQHFANMAEETWPRFFSEGCAASTKTGSRTKLDGPCLPADVGTFRVGAAVAALPAVQLEALARRVHADGPCRRTDDCVRL